MSFAIDHHRNKFLTRALAFLIVLAPIPVTWAEAGRPVCRTTHVDSSIEPFGWIVTYSAGKDIQFPDFNLLAEQTTRPNLEFLVHDTSGKEQKLTVHTSRVTNEPHRFEVNGKQYVMETTHTVLYDRALADNELTVWSDDAYRAQQAKIAAR